MSRNYTLRQRAEGLAETRRRIVEAAIDLHRTLGPARTPLSLVAERAGVQRKTLSAHFKDERSLLKACSGTSLERDPPPDPEPWRSIWDPEARLRTGLTALYQWYRRNSELIASVLRDAEYHAPTRETAELSFGRPMAAIREVLGEGLSGAQLAMLLLALDFAAWRVLVHDGGVSEAGAVNMMAEAVILA
jgi:AcrR family transcriptional regulator